VPGVKKGAFIVGAKFGRGYFTCRKSGVGWSAPGGVRGRGRQRRLFSRRIGDRRAMLVMNKARRRPAAIEQVHPRWRRIGSRGPVGRSATAETDAYLTAEILTWSALPRNRSRGCRFPGATLRQDLDTNLNLYGKPLDQQARSFRATSSRPPWRPTSSPC